MNAPQRTKPATAATIAGLQGHNSTSTFYSYSDPRVEFLSALADSGIHCTEPDRITGDGHLARFHVDGDRADTRNGWAVLFVRQNGSGGAFGHWRTGVSVAWRSCDSRMSQMEQRQLSAAIRLAQQRREAERRREHEAARERARESWESADRANPAHPYLVRKHVQPYGIRQCGSLLVVPLCDVADGTIWNLQRIMEDGTKRFTKGGRVSGLAAFIGTPDGGRLLICEGWATGATLHAETGVPVLCAMNCGNLQAVAKAARRRWPDADMVVCGDDDRHTDGNPGRTAATAAALAIGARLTFPTFAPDEPGTDFNDMATSRQRVAA